MRVVLTCDWFLKYASAQSAALARAGLDVLLLCRTHAHEFGGDHSERSRTLQRARETGVAVVEIPGRLSDPRVAPALVKIRRQLARFAPDVVHAHDGADPRALAILPRRPTVLTLHDPVPHPGQPVPPPKKRWFLHGSRDAWRGRADAIVVHSESLCAEVQLRASQPCVVLPHGMDVRPDPLPPPAERAVAFFGRLTPYKGLDVLGRAMRRVWQTRPDVRLEVAGAGDEGLGLEDRRVRFERRYLPEADLEAFFRRASLAALPYTQASQTGAGSVAVGYGVPVVVSSVGGLADLVLDNSYVVRPGDDAALASAIVRHVDDDAAVRGRVLRDVAGPRSWDAVAAKTRDLYEELL